MEQLSKWILSDMSPLVGLPIKQIDGIDVLVYVEKPEISLIIEAENVVQMDYENMQLYKSGSYKDKPLTEACEIIVDIINHLKFDRVNSKFTRNVRETIFFNSIFNENVKLSYDLCCVCQEITKQMTPCGHCLCIPCWTKIKCCGCAYNMKCPICREFISPECDNCQ